MDLSPEEAWCVGLFEGEGSIVLKKNTDGTYKNTACLSIVSTDYDTIARFQTYIGKGMIKGPYKRKDSSGLEVERWREYWLWRVQSAIEITDLLNKWIPYLGMRRRERAELVINQLKKNKFITPREGCPLGHKLTQENIYSFHNSVTGKKYSYCKVCHNIKAAAYRKKIKCVT
jgi:hypothetical protein